MRDRDGIRVRDRDGIRVRIRDGIRVKINMKMVEVKVRDCLKKNVEEDDRES